MAGRDIVANVNARQVARAARTVATTGRNHSLVADAGLNRRRRRSSSKSSGRSRRRRR